MCTIVDGNKNIEKTILREKKNCFKYVGRNLFCFGFFFFFSHLSETIFQAIGDT